MDKVAGLQYNVPVPSTMSPFSAQERGPMIRGHHSSISKAVDAHREMVEQRSTRNANRRDSTGFSQLNNDDLVVAQQVSGDGMAPSEGEEYSSYENSLIELPSTQAKMASIQSFQSSEPDRPVVGEPVPKGSYLDVEA